MNPVIHILDKSKTYRRILEECLIALGYTNIESFENPDQILGHRIKPDILILEHEMGNKQLSGLEFFRMYGHTRLRHTKFIFLSSNTNLNIAVSAVRMGAFDYIIKSKIGLDRLVNRIGKLVLARKEYYRKTRSLIASVVSLSIVSLFLAMAIYLYNHNSF